MRNAMVLAVLVAVGCAQAVGPEDDVPGVEVPVAADAGPVRWWCWGPDATGSRACYENGPTDTALADCERDRARHPEAPGCFPRWERWAFVDLGQ